MFISGAPDQYFYNDAFKLKVVFLGLMGANAAYRNMTTNGSTRPPRSRMATTHRRLPV